MLKLLAYFIIKCLETRSKEPCSSCLGFFEQLQAAINDSIFFITMTKGIINQKGRFFWVKRLSFI